MNKLILNIFCVLIFFVSSNLFSQINEKEINKDYFYVSPVVFYPVDSAIGRLDLYIEIPLADLQFKKINNDKYSSSVDYTVTIKNSANEILLNQTYTEEIVNTAAEQKKINDKSVSTVKNYFLPADKYSISFSLRDKNTDKEWDKNYTFTVKNILAENFVYSNILLLSNFSQDNSGEKEITPLISNNIGNINKFYLFFDIRNKNSEVISKTYKIKFTDNKEKILYDSTFSVNLKTGTNNIIIPNSAEKFYPGNFKVEIFDQSELMTSANFEYRWADVPFNIKDIDLAIEQCVYIANTDELDEMKAGKTKDERLKRFVKFWKKIDPSPNANRNEIMIEYYERIRVANERYSHYTSGWKTDMGMVYIIYGNPGNIERHPFDADSKPYEIWTYYDINRQYIFVDNTGFGDYRLQTPIWDDRTRLRTGN